MKRINPYLRKQGAKAAYVEYDGFHMVADPGLIRYYEEYFDAWEKCLKGCEERGASTKSALRVLAQYADVLERSYEMRKELQALKK